MPQYVVASRMEKDKSLFKKLFSEVLKFGITGCLCTAFSLAFYYLFLSLNLDKFLANTLSFLCGTVLGYFLNNFWVFKPKVKQYGMVGRFYIVYIASYAISQLMLFVWSDQLGISDKIAPLLNLCITIPFNFFFSKFWVFRVKKGKYKHNHTFAICAYKESPYLEQCIQSVVNQTVKSKVLIATSTPNAYIQNLADKYHLPVYINKGKTGIQEDWNFAVSCCDTDFVTVCHHDDYYKPNFYEQIEPIIQSNIAQKTLTIHTGYYDCDEKGKEILTRNNKIKRFLLFPASLATFQSIKFFKMQLIAFGFTVCCPSCTHNRKLLGENFFNSEFQMCCDWDMFYKLAKMKGRIVYVPEKLMSKRFHKDSTTSMDIVSGLRYKEDLAMFEKMWPKKIAKLLMRYYVKAYEINGVQMNTDEK